MQTKREKLFESSEFQRHSNYKTNGRTERNEKKSKRFVNLSIYTHRLYDAYSLGLCKQNSLRVSRSMRCKFYFLPNVCARALFNVSFKS